MSNSTTRAHNFIDLTGKTFSSLTVISRHYTIPDDGRIHWLCQCECSGSTITRSDCLKSGVTTSCGCRIRKILATHSITHGMSDTPTFKSWAAMKDRCYGQNTVNYCDYGGRGITICERWRESFENFYADMGERPSLRHSIDRIDVDGSYSPENCRWATKREQSNNRRDSLPPVTYNGETRHLSEWADIVGISYSTIRHRIHDLNWSVGRALTEPINKGAKKRGKYLPRPR